ncbi:MAG: DNA-directed RNA polymerase subunit omega [Candidatus Omnitrophica bacterium]|nr:DNA-directed RNA polymerase subunit omega [Candidatus Omnitrophota bacterium]HOX55244.1 DNA-directed RNA polymerase subunit omega [Candidatus Omnitrophota bacterium]
MSYQPIEKLLPHSQDSIYKLVALASQRALELAEGMPSLLEKRFSDKPTVVALDEIAEGKVDMKIDEFKEKAKPKEKDKKKSK